MSKKYTPDTSQVREFYVDQRFQVEAYSEACPTGIVERYAEFDRWLGQLLYEAWDAGLQEGLGGGWEDNPYEEYK